MVTIRALDHVKQCSTYSDGEVIFDLLLPVLKSGGKVALSFDGVRSVPSAFVNSALVRLLEYFPFEVVKESLQIVDSTRQINALIRERFRFASSEGAVPAR